MNSLAKWAALLLLCVGCGNEESEEQISGTYALDGPIDTNEPYVSDGSQLSQIWLSIPSSPITEASRIKLYSAITFNYDNESVTIPWITGHEAGQQCFGEAVEPMALIIETIDSTSFAAQATWDGCHMCGIIHEICYVEKLTIHGQSVAGILNVHLEYNGRTQDLALLPIQNGTPPVIECTDDLYCGGP